MIVMTANIMVKIVIVFVPPQWFMRCVRLAKIKDNVQEPSMIVVLLMEVLRIRNLQKQTVNAMLIKNTFIIKSVAPGE